MIVTRVDGDTFETRIGNETKPVTVRVISYDAPEKDQLFGDTATKFLKSFLEGREVLLEPDV